MTEISSRDVHLAVLTNFDSFHILRRLNDHHAGGYSLEMSDTIFSDAPSLPTVLHRSRLGFLLGVTLLALDLEGHGGLWRRYAGGPGASQQFDADANSATGAPIAGGFAAPFGAPNSTGGSASQTYSPAGPSNWEMDDDKGSGKAGADDGASTRGAFATGDIKVSSLPRTVARRNLLRLAFA